MRRWVLYRLQVFTFCLAAWLAQQPVLARSEGQATACKSNLKNIGTALEMWAADHGGAYPDSLQALVPEYLRVIPECPVSHADTYSDTYRISKRKTVFGVCCAGDGHVKSGYLPNHPAYNSIQGIVEGVAAREVHGPSLVECEKTLALVAELANSDAKKPSKERPAAYGPYSDYWVDYSMEPSAESGGLEGYEVICVGHAHGRENVPPLYPRFDSSKGVERFTLLDTPPTPTPPAPLNLDPKQAIPAAAVVLLLVLVGSRGRLRKSP